MDSQNQKRSRLTPGLASPDPPKDMLFGSCQPHQFVCILFIVAGGLFIWRYYHSSNLSQTWRKAVAPSEKSATQSAGPAPISVADLKFNPPREKHVMTNNNDLTGTYTLYDTLNLDAANANVNVTVTVDTIVPRKKLSSKLHIQATHGSITIHLRQTRSTQWRWSPVEVVGGVFRGENVLGSTLDVGSFGETSLSHLTALINEDCHTDAWHASTQGKAARRRSSTSLQIQFDWLEGSDEHDDLLAEGDFERGDVRSFAIPIENGKPKYDGWEMSDVIEDGKPIVDGEHIWYRTGRGKYELRSYSADVSVTLIVDEE